MAEEHACACGGSCGCGGNHQHEERYLTRDEYVARLEEYLVDLRNEIAAVERELADLRQVAS